MKLYHKQLNSLDELKQEKQRLKDVLKKTEQEGFISLNDVLPVKTELTKGATDDTDVVSRVSDLLGGAGIKETLLSLGAPILELIGSNIEKKTLKKVAKELLGGYVKWKAMELGYKGLKLLIENRKKKKEEKKDKA